MSSMGLDSRDPLWTGQGLEFRESEWGFGFKARVAKLCKSDVPVQTCAKSRNLQNLLVQYPKGFKGSPLGLYRDSHAPNKVSYSSTTRILAAARLWAPRRV